MIIVDSGVWIDFFNGVLSPGTDFLDVALGIEPIGVGDVILMEVLQGFQLDRDYRRAYDALTSLTVFAMLGPDQAIRAAEAYRLLRRRGRTTRTSIDTIIASFCCLHDHLLLYRDRDFQPFVDELGLRSALTA